ncbi:MAG: hypothetical protein RIC55_17130 [Pirellulaceae bacterium]
MRRIVLFLSGMALGAVFTFISLKYHIVNAKDGLHLVPKATAEFGGTYIDVRNFTLQDWDQHRGLALALVQADKSHLLEESASDNLRKSVDSMLDVLGDKATERIRGAWRAGDTSNR